MRKSYLFVMALVFMIVLAGCGNSIGKMMSGADSEPEEAVTEETAAEEDEMETDESDETEETDVAGEAEEADEAAAEDQADLKLQVLKIDEEEGFTLDNNEIYQTIQSEIDTDPKMGVPNDFSLYPYDIVYYEDGSLALLSIAINRLNKPIRNMAFDLTLGNQDGDLIFEKETIDMPEELVGILEVDGAVPIFTEITEEDEELFASLTQENLHIDMDNFQIDFVE